MTLWPRPANGGMRQEADAGSVVFHGRLCRGVAAGHTAQLSSSTGDRVALSVCRLSQPREFSSHPSGTPTAVSGPPWSICGRFSHYS